MWPTVKIKLHMEYIYWMLWISRFWTWSEHGWSCSALARYLLPICHKFFETQQWSVKLKNSTNQRTSSKKVTTLASCTDLTILTVFASFSHWQLQMKSKFISTFPNGVISEKAFSLRLQSSTVTDTSKDT